MYKFNCIRDQYDRQEQDLGYNYEMNFDFAVIKVGYMCGWTVDPDPVISLLRPRDSGPNTEFSVNHQIRPDFSGSLVTGLKGFYHSFVLCERLLLAPFSSPESLHSI